MSITDVTGEKRIFLRKASGLIRTASGTDTFIYNLGVVSIGLGVGTMLFYGPAFYPQGNLVWGCIIAGVAMAMISFGFITWTITLPRSGGIYVFGSRILPPALALTMSLVEITAWLFYCAIAAYWIVILALAPMFAALGLLTGSESFSAISAWMLQPWATFLIGAAILVLSGIILSFGMRFYLMLNKWVFILAMASTVLLITADTYSKHIYPQDRSVRTLFGDAAAVTILTGVNQEKTYKTAYVLKTDGRGAEHAPSLRFLDRLDLAADGDREGGADQR